MRKISFRKFFSMVLGGFLASFSCAWGFELDWSGQFWSDFSLISAYTFNASGSDQPVSATKANNGYYVPPAGSHTSKFGTVFLRLNPKIAVNDRIFIKSEFWIGNPAFSLLGDGLPNQSADRTIMSTVTAGSTLTAQRVFLELLSDLGTIQVGRLPLNFGLGMVWNQGSDLFARYESTADGIRWLAKFGSFSFVPSFFMRSSGDCIGGACLSATTDKTYALGQVYEGSLVLKYANTDDQIEAGVNIIKRLSQGGQDPKAALLAPAPSYNSSASANSQSNYLLWDLYFRKSFGKFSLSAEAPIATGSIGGVDMSAYGLAVEGLGELADAWTGSINTGLASGQKSFTGNVSQYQFFYFHPNYQVANILFRYQLANFSQQNALIGSTDTVASQRSIYSSAITNAFYLSAGAKFKPSLRWTLNPSLTWARALQVAKSGRTFLNSWDYSFAQNNTNADQLANLGIEFDFNTKFEWDEKSDIRLETGMLFPGRFFSFDNTSSTNQANTPLILAAIRIGVKF
jgi:hypothetical protein